MHCIIYGTLVLGKVWHMLIYALNCIMEISSIYFVTPQFLFTNVYAMHIKVWISNYIQEKQWEVITHPKTFGFKTLCVSHNKLPLLFYEWFRFLLQLWLWCSKSYLVSSLPYSYCRLQNFMFEMNILWPFRAYTGTSKYRKLARMAKYSIMLVYTDALGHTVVWLSMIAVQMTITQHWFS